MRTSLSLSLTLHKIREVIHLVAHVKRDVIAKIRFVMSIIYLALAINSIHPIQRVLDPARIEKKKENRQQFSTAFKKGDPIPRSPMVLPNVPRGPHDLSRPSPAQPRMKFAAKRSRRDYLAVVGLPGPGLR